MAGGFVLINAKANISEAEYKKHQTKSFVGKLYNGISIIDMLSSVWLLGVIVFFMRGLISYLLFMRTMRKNSTITSCPALVWPDSAV